MNKTLDRAELIYNHIRLRDSFYLSDILNLLHLNNHKVQISYMQLILPVVKSRYKINWRKVQEGRRIKPKYVIIK